MLVLGAVGTDPYKYTVTCVNAVDNTKVLPTGIFTVTATAEAGAVGCRQSGSKQTIITVTAPPVVGFTGDTAAAVSRQTSPHIH